MRRVSKKLQARLPAYNVLIKELREGCGNRSELSGMMADWLTWWNVEPHHIGGRIGDNLTNPFNIIMLTRGEHDIQDSNGWERKQELLNYIKVIRLKQGYKE